MLPMNPVLLVDKLPVERTKKSIPTPEEMVGILVAAGADRPMFLVIFHLMARVDEIMRLKWEDVNFEHKGCGCGLGSAGGVIGNRTGSP